MKPPPLSGSPSSLTARTGRSADPPAAALRWCTSYGSSSRWCRRSRSRHHRSRCWKRLLLWLQWRRPATRSGPVEQAALSPARCRNPQPIQQAPLRPVPDEVPFPSFPPTEFIPSRQCAPSAGEIPAGTSQNFEQAGFPGRQATHSGRASRPRGGEPGQFFAHAHHLADDHQAGAAHRGLFDLARQVAEGAGDDALPLRAALLHQRR